MYFNVTTTAFTHCYAELNFSHITKTYKVKSYSVQTGMKANLHVG